MAVTTEKGLQPVRCRRLELAELWVLCSAFLSATGWLLSALGFLNPVGYLAALVLAIGAGLLFWRRTHGAGASLTRLRWGRFRRAFPFCILLIAVLCLSGGVLYGPSNYDALSYRLPRVLDWLAEGRWHWIHVEDARLNTRSCGFEWLMAPMLLFLRSDRPLFLINFISFLLLPGLVFQCLRAFGVCRRVAWYWMWLVPSGYCFVLQAGSISNDSFAAVYALAGMVFALRAGSSGNVRQAWLALLAAGLLTGAKGSNLPLLLPIGLALLPAAKLILSRPIGSLCAVAISALVSFLPTAWLNVRHCGDWTGAIIEPKLFLMSNPFMGLIGNAAQFLIGNFQPPFFPWARYWNDHAAELLPGSLVRILQNYFEAGAWNIGELPTEEGAALGFGLSVLLVLSLLGGAVVASKVLRTKRINSLWLTLLVMAPVVALAGYSMKSGLNSAGRLITPYYCLLLPLLLRGWGQALVIRTSWWRNCGLVVFILAALVVIATPARPLWPAITLIHRFQDAHPDSLLLARAERVCRVYRGRNEALTPIQALLPADEKVIGMVSWGDDPVASLWKPFGLRQLVFFLPKDSISEVQGRGVRYVVISPNGVQDLFGMNAEDWARRFNADIMGHAIVDRKAGGVAEEWTVVKLRNRQAPNR